MDWIFLSTAFSLRSLSLLFFFRKIPWMTMNRICLLRTTFSMSSLEWIYVLHSEIYSLFEHNNFVWAIWKLSALPMNLLICVVFFSSSKMWHSRPVSETFDIPIDHHKCIAKLIFASTILLTPRNLIYSLSNISWKPVYVTTNSTKFIYAKQRPIISTRCFQQLRSYVLYSRHVNVSWLYEYITRIAKK